MGLLKTFNNWRSARQENFISNMSLQNKCPDCRGKGYNIYPAASEFIPYDNTYDCPGCNGSGLFTDWSQG